MIYITILYYLILFHIKLMQHKPISTLKNILLSVITLLYST